MEVLRRLRNLNLDCFSATLPSRIIQFRETALEALPSSSAAVLLYWKSNENFGLVVTSSAEAEVRQLTPAIKTVEWVRHIVEESQTYDAERSN